MIVWSRCGWPCGGSVDTHQPGEAPHADCPLPRLPIEPVAGDSGRAQSDLRERTALDVAVTALRAGRQRAQLAMDIFVGRQHEAGGQVHQVGALRRIFAKFR